MWFSGGIFREVAVFKALNVLSVYLISLKKRDLSRGFLLPGGLCKKMFSVLNRKWPWFSSYLYIKYTVFLSMIPDFHFMIVWGLPKQENGGPKVTGYK